MANVGQAHWGVSFSGLSVGSSETLLCGKEEPHAGTPLVT